jgi:hypothetical protein
MKGAMHLRGRSFGWVPAAVSIIRVEWLWKRTESPACMNIISKFSFISIQKLDKM